MKTQLYWKMFNPFFWFNWLFIKMIRALFRILGAAGFDSAKIENSPGGRTVKAVSGFVVFVAALLTALQILGWLEPIRRFAYTVIRLR